jgi:hypothetical protein
VELLVRMMACDEPPPTWRLELENEASGSLPLFDTATEMLAELLEREGAHPSRVREIVSSEPPDDMPSGGRSHDAVADEVHDMDSDDEERTTPMEAEHDP